MAQTGALSTVSGLTPDVVHDTTKGLGALLHLRQLRFAQFLTDQVRDALLADADWDAEEHLFRDAVPTLRQRAQREHAPLYYIHTYTHTHINFPTKK